MQTRPRRPDGVFADMYGSPNAEDRIKSLEAQGWTKIVVVSRHLDNFFAMKDWCEATAGALGEQWINVNLRTFMFARRDIAALFKLTFWHPECS